MIRCTKDIVDVAKSRGFKIIVKDGPPKMPCLVGDRQEATPALLEALKAFRLEIIEFVEEEQKSAELKTKSKLREWLWRDGRIETEICEDETGGGTESHRTGAFWYRFASGTPWKPVPGREGFAKQYPLPKELDT